MAPRYHECQNSTDCSAGHRRQQGQQLHMTWVTLSPLFYPLLYPSFLSLSVSSHNFLLFLRLIASSSFKNHFTLGKTRHHPMHLSVCWMAEINKLFHAVSFIIEWPIWVPCWRCLCLACMRIWLPFSAVWEKTRRSIFISPSESRLASVTCCNSGRYFSSSARFLTSKPRSEGWEGQGEMRTHTLFPQRKKKKFKVMLFSGRSCCCTRQQRAADI